MQSPTRHDIGRPPSSTQSRSNSMSSASLSIRRPSLFTAFPMLTPAPAYVASVPAASLAIEQQQFRANEEPLNRLDGQHAQIESATVSENAVALINSFLDDMLYHIITITPPTSLSRIRLGVDMILKGTLAKNAISSADAELESILRGEEEEVAYSQDELDNMQKYNIETIFKRTRLRIMVYSSLGAMEDEQEEAYLEDENNWNLNSSADTTSECYNLLSMPAIIFLTGILDYLAERCVEEAGRSAYGRLASQGSGMNTSDSRSPGPGVDSCMLIDEYDVEKVTYHRTLGRVWRTWRKSSRNPRSLIFPSSSMHMARSFHISRHSSTSTLRNASASHPNQDIQARGGLAYADQNSSPNQPPAFRISGQSFDTYVLGKAEKLSLSSVSEPHGGKKRGEPSTPQSTLVPLLTTSFNGRTSPNHSLELRSFGHSGDADSTMESLERARLDGITEAVPVTGVLNFHFSSRSSNKTPAGYNVAREESIARFDFADVITATRQPQPVSAHTPPHNVMDARMPQTNGVGRNNQPDERLQGLRDKDKRTERDGTTVSEGPWHRDLPGADHYSSTDEALPLTVAYAQQNQSSSGLEGSSSNYKDTSSGPIVTGDFRDDENIKSSRPMSMTKNTLNAASDCSYTPTSPGFPQSGPSYIPARPVADASNPANLSLGSHPGRSTSQALQDASIAREPCGKTESTHDFADFIRSTAPTNEQTRIIPVRPSYVEPKVAMSFNSKLNGIDSSRGSVTTPHSNRQASPDSKEKPELIVGRPYSSLSLTYVRDPSLEPRDAVVRGQSNDDLIAFLKEGPPGAGQPLPTARDYMERRTADRFNTATASMRTSGVTLNSESKHESHSSDSALLYRTLSPTKLIAHETSDQPAGTKKQSRVKDPYAIPSDNEDEDILTALPRRGQTNESLIEFLSSTGPTNANNLSARSSFQATRTSPDATSHGDDGFDSSSLRGSQKIKQDGKNNMVKDLWRKIAA